MQPGDGYWVNAKAATAVVAAPTSISASYFDFHYLQNVNGIASSTATITDNGAAAGSVTFGPAAIVSSFLSAGAGYTWGAPITAAQGFDTNAADLKLPAVAEICSPATLGGVALTTVKSTDVLVTSLATPITNVAVLANLTFAQHHLNCAATVGQSAVFDANGNVVFAAANGAAAPQIYTAAQFTSALAGTPVPFATAGSAVFNAYSYVNASGAIKYVIVGHHSPLVTGLTQGAVGVWLQ
jgi:hypothetical protein